MKKTMYGLLMFITVLAIGLTGCAGGGSGDSFTPQTIAWQQEGDEIRYFTNDTAEADEWHSVYINTVPLSGDFTMTQTVRKVSGNAGNAYGIMFVADWDNWIKLSICENGSYHVSWEDGGTFGWTDWTDYAPLNTAVGTEHTLKMTYVTSTGEVNFYYGSDTTPLYTDNLPTGASGYAGMSCYTGDASQSLPYDYRFKITAPSAYP